MTATAYDAIDAEYYDASPVVTARRDLPFYLTAASEQGGPILELGCGTGRIALGLAEAGHRTTGLDLSARMLARAAEKRAALPAAAQERVQLVQGDMTRFDLGKSFRLILIPFRPFQHLLELQQQVDCLACVRRHLDAGGRLILDFFHPDPRRLHDPAFLKESAPIAFMCDREAVNEYEMSGGRRVILTERTVAFHYGRQCNDVELIYNVAHPDGSKERLVFAFTVRYFFPFEVEHLLARCGFRVQALYGNLDRSPLGDSSPEMIFVAEPE